MLLHCWGLGGVCRVSGLAWDRLLCAVARVGGEEGRKRGRDGRERGSERARHAWGAIIHDSSAPILCRC